MEDKLLLINKRPDVVDEFVKAYEHEEFQIDIAMNGVEAVRKLQASEYKLVVVGLIFPDIDGEKLLGYINKTAPETVCIVYATRISVAQIAYLTNRLHVFRIFLRPVEYRLEMLEAIQEGFEEYDLKKRMFEIAEEEKEKMQFQQDRYAQMRKKVLDRQKADGLFLRVCDPILKELAYLGDNLKEEEQQQLLDIQKGIIAQYLKEHQLPVGGLTAIEVKLRHQFFEGNANRSLRVHTGSALLQLPEPFIEGMYMCIWVLIHRMTMLTKQFDAYVDVDFETSSKISLNVSFQLPPGVWEEQKRRAISKKITYVYESVVKEICGNMYREVEDIRVSYKLHLDAGRQVEFEA